MTVTRFKECLLKESRLFWNFETNKDWTQKNLNINILKTLKVDPVSRLIIRVQVWSRLWEAETRGSEGPGSVPPAPAHRQHMSGQSQSDMMGFELNWAKPVDKCLKAIRNIDVQEKVYNLKIKILVVKLE